jgi:hypothetical protein
MSTLKPSSNPSAGNAPTIAATEPRAPAQRAPSARNATQMTSTGFQEYVPISLKPSPDHLRIVAEKSNSSGGYGPPTEYFAKSYVFDIPVTGQGFARLNDPDRTLTVDPNLKNYQRIRVFGAGETLIETLQFSESSTVMKTKPERK